jgi:UDP-N-acetylmuramoyl-L-alanyl-D-glutamate--2,6-diaminopimelate ligase
MNSILSEELRQLKVTGITADSRKVQEGFVFVALVGSAYDGRDYIQDAVVKGASAIIVDKDFQLELLNIPIFRVENPRRTFSALLAHFYGQQPDNIVAITGTNGKTSTAHFYRLLSEQLGGNAASIGTLGVISPYPIPVESSLTTPGAEALYHILKLLKENGTNFLALEASSHGLDQYRLDAVKLQAAAFTNLSQDHFEYHHNFESYLAAKLRLFTEILPKGKIAVLNADIPEYGFLKQHCETRAHRIIDYGKQAKEIRLNSAVSTIEEQVINFSYQNSTYQFATPLIGEFQAYNLLCAFGLAVATGFTAEQIVERLPKLTPVPGRMDRVTRKGEPRQVFVDYSHTPDALEKALSLLKPLCKGRLIALFGCGGNRDPYKRPLMGNVASNIADVVIVTDDNPRHEDPAKIRQEVMEGCNQDVIEVGGRMEAINYAVRIMQPHDILLIAGKGHENYQIIGDQYIKFDDLEVAKAALEL